jgi:hypothetical protein
VGQMLAYHPSSRTAENIPDKEQFHRESYLSSVTMTVRGRDFWWPGMQLAPYRER